MSLADDLCHKNLQHKRDGSEITPSLSNWQGVRNLRFVKLAIRSHLYGPTLFGRFVVGPTHQQDGAIGDLCS